MNAYDAFTGLMEEEGTLDLARQSSLHIDQAAEKLPEAGLPERGYIFNNFSGHARRRTPRARPNRRVASERSW